MFEGLPLYAGVAAFVAGLVASAVLGRIGVVVALGLAGLTFLLGPWQITTFAPGAEEGHGARYLAVARVVGGPALIGLAVGSALGLTLWRSRRRYAADSR